MRAVSSDTRSRSLAKEDSVLTQEALQTCSGSWQGLLVPVPDLPDWLSRRRENDASGCFSFLLRESTATFRDGMSPREDFDLSMRGASVFRGSDLISICSQYAVDATCLQSGGISQIFLYRDHISF